MATPDDTETQTAPPPATPAEDPTSAYLRQALAQLTAPPPSVQPDTTPVKRGWLSLLGEGLGGGQETGAMSPAQSESAGLRSLMQFGTGLMAASHYQPGQTAFSNLAQGFQGAGQSERGSEQMAAGQLAAQQGYQMKQQELQMERLKAALPLLTLQQQAQMASNARNLASGATPGTATGAGQPGTIAPPAVAYGQGGPGSTIPVPPEYMQYFQDASKRTGVPVDLLIAQARQESGFNPNAAGGGLMQIQDKTALKPGFGMQGVQSPAILKDPATNINFGADYLAARAKAVGADLSTPQGQAAALQAYNGGGDPNYVQNVTRYMPKPGAGPAPGQYAGPGVPAGGAPAAPAAPLPVPPAAPAGGPPAAAPAVPAAPGATTQPAVTPPPAQPPPPVPHPDIPVPGGGAISHPGEFADFKAKQYVPPTGEDFNPSLTPEQQAAFATKAQQLQLKQQQIGTTLMPADQAKALIEVKQQQADLTAEQQNAITAKQQAAAAATTKYNETQNKDIQTRYDASTLAYNTAAQSQLANNQAIQLEQAKGRTADESKVMQGLDETRESARSAVDQISIARALSQSAGDPTFWQTVQKSHPAVVQAMANSGFLSPETVGQLGQAGALDAAVNKLISMARTGSGFQRMTNMDVQILSSQAPQSVDPQQWREAKLAYLQSYMERQLHYVDAVRSLRADGTPLYQAQNQAAKDQGDVVQQIPNFVDTPQKSAVQQRIDWAQKNVAPNTFFRAPDSKPGANDGQLRIYQGPQAAAPSQQPPASAQRSSLVPVN